MKKEVDDMSHVGEESVDDIATMPLLLAVPFRPEDAVEQSLLHPVACPDAKDVLHPYHGDVDGKIAQHDDAHDSHTPIDGAGLRPRGDVDGILYGLYSGKADDHPHEAEGCVEQRLEPVAFPSLPKPYEDFLRGVFALLRCEIVFYSLENVHTLQLSGVCTPHHLLFQGVEILLSMTLDDFRCKRRLLDGEQRTLGTFLRPSVDGDEELVAPALHTHGDHGVVGNDDGPDIEAMGCDG